jgi:formylmethanofuran dehydrogenase subunit D
MAAKRFILNAGRTSKQGQQINVGKDDDEYQAIVGTLTMHPDDMQALALAPGATVRVRSEYGGEVTFRCQAGKFLKG